MPVEELEELFGDILIGAGGGVKVKILGCRLTVEEELEEVPVEELEGELEELEKELEGGLEKELEELKEPFSDSLIEADIELIGNSGGISVGAMTVTVAVRLEEPAGVWSITNFGGRLTVVVGVVVMTWG